ncbi:MAG: hypothetical protein ACOVRM_06410 [Planctomycetaceae bacterium]
MSTQRRARIRASTARDSAAVFCAAAADGLEVWDSGTAWPPASVFRQL